MRDQTKPICCPSCGSKMHVLMKTTLQFFPLFYPKCKRVTMVEVRNPEVNILNPESEPDTLQ